MTDEDAASLAASRIESLQYLARTSIAEIIRMQVMNAAAATSSPEMAGGLALADSAAAEQCANLMPEIDRHVAQFAEYAEQQLAWRIAELHERD